MAPFRGRGGRRGGRGAANPSGKLARSGIRTKSGYRKFDSQRVKDIEESEDEIPQVEEDEKEGHEGLDEDLSDNGEDGECISDVKAYSALMQSFQSAAEDNGRKRKRRKVEAKKPVEADEEEAEGGSEVSSDADVEFDEDGPADDQDEVAQISDASSSFSVEVDEEEGDLTDPFEAHFAPTDESELSNRINFVKANEWRMEKQHVSGLGSFIISAPKSVEGRITRKPAVEGVAGDTIKKRLADSSRDLISSLDDVQRAIAPYIFSYTDLLVGSRTPENAGSLRTLACLHSLNHVLKGRDKVLKHTARLAQVENPETLDLRDQGFTRPKVLVLTETRQMASNYADCIVSLFQPDQQENKQRFKDSFTALIDDRDAMPEDYRELFDGNNDSNFLTALKFTRKTLKFFSAFYASDIILASPLGLRRIIENEDKKKRDWDFLSSIEVIIVDQADAMQMQNWENIEVVFEHLNLHPRGAHGTDFNRVRSWCLDGNAKYLRQTIFFSAYITPEMNRLFNTNMLNIAGRAKLVPNYDGAIAAPAVAGLGIKQTFTRFDSPSPISDPDARFKYFTNALLPSLLRLPKPADGAQGILVFIPSYYDFLRLRNFFATSTLTQNVSFGTIHDYSEVSDQRRARSHFLSGRHSILLYTQRAHHFFRLKIRGVKRVVMYGVADNAVFYEELVGGFLGTSVGEGRLAPEEAGVRAMFSKWDGLRMERVVGSRRVKGMLGGMADTFDFI